MKTYPSIDRDIRSDVHIYAFDKLDGSNIRAEWSAKRGFYKFGTRNTMMDETNKQFGKAIPLIKEKYEEHLAMVFKEHEWREVICFFEYYGPGSFAGNHLDTELQTVTLFDINPYKHGILEPRDFIKFFGHLDIPKVLFEGKVNSTFVDIVKDSTLAYMTFEGVVCKGQNDKKTKMPIMFKIKSRAWLERLKTFCKGDENMFSRLA